MPTEVEQTDGVGEAGQGAGMTSTDMLPISVVVPTHNRAGSLARCINALPHDVEIVVVDDGSTDWTREVVERTKHRQLRYVKQPNGGPASARNSGIRKSHGEIVAFTDDDCVPAPGWIHNLASRLRREPDSIGGVGGRVCPLGEGLISRYSTFHHILEPPPSLSYLVTANCAYRREALELSGGFDESIRHPGGEDPELSFRLGKLGYRFVYEPSAVVYHDYRESVVDFARTFYRYGKGCSHVVA